MHIFIHQYHLHISEHSQDFVKYQHILDFQNFRFSSNLFKGFVGTVLIHNISINDFQKLVFYLDKEENLAISKLLVWVDKEEEFSKSLASIFEIVPAAGGLVIFQDKILMIFRRGKWDLPKGKIDEGEDEETASLREVKEECNIVAEIKQKIATTWHHYWNNGKIVLKRTEWFLMSTQQPEAILPQIEEDIEIIAWKTPEEVVQALDDSFTSIKYVIQIFNQLSSK